MTRPGQHIAAELRYMITGMSCAVLLSACIPERVVVTVRATLAATATLTSAVNNSGYPEQANYNPPTPDPTYLVPVTPAGTPAGAGRIVQIGQPPYPAYVACTDNVWYMVNGSKAIEVYGCAYRSDTVMEFPHPWQGFLSVWVWSGSTPLPNEGGSYNTPKKSGVLRIIDAEGMRLVVEAEDGTTYYFDVAARQYVDSLSTILPTVNVAATQTQARAYPVP